MNASGTPNTCKSNEFCFVAIQDTISGKRASNAYLICPKVENNYRDVANSQYAHDGEIPMWGKIYRFWRRVRPIMVVGKVMAYQAFDG
jgi:hypothetical protein